MDLRTKSVQLKIIHKAYWTSGMLFPEGAGEPHGGNGNKEIRWREVGTSGIDTGREVTGFPPSVVQADYRVCYAM